MAEKELQLGSQQEADKEVEAAEKRKGSQRIEIKAWVDSDSVVVFELPERVVKHFSIDPQPSDMTNKVKLYGTGGKKGEKHPILGGTLSRPGQKIMKFIRIPCGEKEPITIKRGGKTVNVKEVLVRVPAAMNLNALALWINANFKQNAPKSFKTAKNIKFYIDATFKDKSKLKALKEAK